ncbi:hypothetical protein [Streptomyces sp. GESEQ-13]|uniref:hypothetical protein n=1 Tax=Streptomyces sp. GESEQ-13 TaxID=2812654 RepID=UPI001B3313D4
MEIKVDPDRTTYEMFKNEVRRFNQQALLELIAAKCSALEREEVMRWSPTFPWALAATAQASLIYGNAHRSTIPRDTDLARCCLLYANITPLESTGGHLATPLSILTRIAFEQFPYQESGSEEVARAYAFFNAYSDRKPLEVISDQTLCELLGASVTEAVGVGLLLHGGAYYNRGYFDPAWLDQPNFADVLNVVPRHTIESVIKSHYLIDVPGFRAKAADAPANPLLPQYTFNPLTERPFIQMPDGRALAPVPHLVTRKLSPIELYYAGIKRFGVAFARDMGELFEDYIGRQFDALPHATVTPEIEYRVKKSPVKTVDWFVTVGGHLLLVEAKASRFTLGSRTGDEGLEAQLQQTVGKAFTQINRTHRALLAGQLGESVPRDLPIFGMVATLDSAYGMNGVFVRKLLPETNVPVVVASARDIEMLVAIGQREDVGPILQGIISGEQSTWHLGPALSEHYQQGDKNPLHEAAWSKYPFG